MPRGQAVNPILPLHTYIPDAEPHVFGDRIYLFGSHDKEGGDTFCMLDYEVWSAPIDVLSDWTTRGVSYKASQDPLYSEKKKYMYAPDCVRGNDGRYYLYYCLAGYKGAGGYDGPISVAVCDTPDGKYEYLGYVRNADGTPFDECVVFDPALINDNGIVRLYGGTALWQGIQITKANRLFTSKLAAGIYHRPASQFKVDDNPLGAFMLVLDDDMMTVRSLSKNILPLPSKENGFAGHAFYEGASIRIIDDRYYFIYSSERNHELCYAVSDKPDSGYIYGGTIVSNGDIGYNGRREKDRLNHTGTTHGSIEKINDKWYVFYHRQTHGTDYSRQVCAEEIEILPDGSIPQVEITSCGLNNGALIGRGKYSAAICCNLTNGKMPHGGNRTFKRIPMITSSGGELYLANLHKGTAVRYKYFDITHADMINVTARGTGALRISDGVNTFCTLSIDSQQWQGYSGTINSKSSRASLTFEVVKGNIEILDFELS